MRVAYLLPDNLMHYVGPVGVWADIEDIIQDGLQIMKVHFQFTFIVCIRLPIPKGFLWRLNASKGGQIAVMAVLKPVQTFGLQQHPRVHWLHAAFAGLLAARAANCYCPAKCMAATWSLLRDKLCEFAKQCLDLADLLFWPHYSLCTATILLLV